MISELLHRSTGFGEGRTHRNTGILPVLSTSIYSVDLWGSYSGWVGVSTHIEIAMMHAYTTKHTEPAIRTSDHNTTLIRSQFL